MRVLKSAELGFVLIRFVGWFAGIFVDWREDILIIHSGERHDRRIKSLVCRNV